jgi:spore germination protein YaaH
VESATKIPRYSRFSAQTAFRHPNVANILNGVWDGALVSRIIADPALTTVNIESLVQLAVTQGYDGIDLDYENLSASDRLAFTSFVNQLAVALHSNGKLLAVNLYAKTSEPGTWGGPQAQDWWAIGQVVDQVRIMTYEYHWSTSGAGPIAPVDWVRDVLAFARTTMPAEKIMQGVPLYGYDWVGQSGVDVVWEQTIALVTQYGATVRWDAASASPWFEYVAKRTRHTVWFENASSIDAKLQVNIEQAVGGLSFWRLGGQDPEVWSTLRNRFGGRWQPLGFGCAIRQHHLTGRCWIVVEDAAARGACERQHRRAASGVLHQRRALRD